LIECSWTGGECDKMFRDKTARDAHVLSVHEKKRNWACHKCAKTYAAKSGLVKHQNTKGHGVVS
jgi:hypothetical protein